MSVRVRIPPSPTGQLHVGTARTAIFNELFARQQKGTFILRIEDTDTTRSKKEYEENILEGLAWLGLTWDEGPDKGGPSAPYRQSERKTMYEEALRTLITARKAYFCSCPPRQEGESAPMCTCHKKESAFALDHEQGLPIRLLVDPQTVTFEDKVRGKIAVATESFGHSFVIARSLQDPLYHLAVVVDDALMKITHVIRGEDHISNTPKHILIQRALGYPQPVYAHVPLLLDERRRKLSKRRGETNLLVYRDQGYLPEAMLNYLALLGWSPKNDQEFFTHEGLIQSFRLDGIQKGGAIFSLQKLQAINKHYLRQLSPEELLERVGPYLEKARIDTGNRALLTAALQTEQERVSTLAELPEAIRFFLPDWSAQYESELLIWRKSDASTTTQLLQKLITYLTNIPEEQWSQEQLEKSLLTWIDEQHLGRGDTLWPMRVALTGQANSPGPFEVAAILGKKVTLQRLQVARKKLG
jgi:glutamyl-tRNA synthetase